MSSLQFSVGKYSSYTPGSFGAVEIHYNFNNLGFDLKINGGNGMNKKEMFLDQAAVALSSEKHHKVFKYWVKYVKFHISIYPPTPFLALKIVKIYTIRI